jgi:hypothetical protein
MALLSADVVRKQQYFLLLGLTTDRLRVVDWLGSASFQEALVCSRDEDRHLTLSFLVAA